MNYRMRNNSRQKMVFSTQLKIVLAGSKRKLPAGNGIDDRHNLSEQALEILYQSIVPSSKERSSYKTKESVYSVAGVY